MNHVSTDDVPVVVDRVVVDRIEVRGLELLLFCGVLDEEQIRRQPFRIDIDIYADLAGAGDSDRLEQTVNYGAVIDEIGAKLTDERFQLLERAATRIAELVLTYELVDAVTVTMAKKRPPVAANVETTGVTIHRKRG